MRCSWLVSVILALLFVPFCFSTEAAFQFEEANKAYRAGDFRKAVELYRQITSQGFASADLYYNLGNALYKMNQVPAAILQYERALRLAPGDEDIRHNLSLANLQISDRIDPIPELFLVTWWKGFLSLFSAGQWGWNGLFAMWMAFGSLALLFFPLRYGFFRKPLSILAVVSLAAFVVCLSGMIGRMRFEKSHRFAILQSPSVHAHSAPDEQSTQLFVIHEGLKVEVLDAVSGWSKIRLADGKVAWIDSSTFEGI